MRLASFNVNSIRARLDGFLLWLDNAQPDIVLLQEIKCVEADFPFEPFGQRGYQILLKGQKSYNGVAILTRAPAELILDALPHFDEDAEGALALDDAQARFIEAKIDNISVMSIYLPNGNPLYQESSQELDSGQSFSEKFHYKLSWMRRLNHYLKTKLDSGQPFLLGGDFNVLRSPEDAYNPEAFANDALGHSESVGLFHQCLGFGLIDAWRVLHPYQIGYSYWDLWKSRFQRDEGLRIDYFLLSPAIADRLKACEVDKTPRGSEKPSDHTPLILEISD